MLSILDFLRLRNRERMTFLENRHAFSNVPSTIAAGYNTFLRFINGERNVVFRRRCAEKKGNRRENRGELHARSLRNRERREIRDVHFFERRNASCTKRADDLGVPACGPHAASPSSRFPVPTPFVSQSR